MVKSQLIQLVRNFSQEELKEFKLFVHSPYFNRGVFVRETQQLCDFLTANLPNCKDEDLSREKAYEFIFPGKTLVAGKIEKVMSELHKMAKEFVVIHKNDAKENQFNQLMQLAIYYRENNMDSRYLFVISQMEELQSKGGGDHVEHLKRQCIFDLELHHFYSFRNKKRDDNYTQKALESLDLTYLSQKIFLLNYYLLQQKIARINIPDDIAQSIRESHLPARYEEISPALFISYSIFKLLELEQPDVDSFEFLRVKLNEVEDKINPEDLQYHFTYLRNILTVMYNKGNHNIMPILFEFQKEHFQRGYLHYEGKISYTAFISLVSNGLKLQQYGWVEKLISDHKGEISHDPDNEYYNLALAMFYFAKKRFEETLEVLPQSIKDLDYQFAAKRLELKAYYEMHSELLTYKIDAFRMFISRASQKMLSFLIEELNINFTNMLIQINNTTPGNKAKMETLRKRLETKTSISDRDWLLEKILELGKRR